jgi:hypothetical protein
LHLNIELLLQPQCQFPLVCLKGLAIRSRFQLALGTEKFRLGRE